MERYTRTQSKVPQDACVDSEVHVLCHPDRSGKMTNPVSNNDLSGPRFKLSGVSSLWLCKVGPCVPVKGCWSGALVPQFRVTDNALFEMWQR